jgi:transposase
MKKDSAGKSMRVIKTELQHWMKDVERDDIDEKLNFKSIEERNLLAIVNYFRFGVTNACAENINSRFQRFVMINQSIRGRNFLFPDK